MHTDYTNDAHSNSKSLVCSHRQSIFERTIAKQDHITNAGSINQSSIPNDG